MAKVKDIIPEDELKLLKLTHNDDEIVALAKQRYQGQKKQQIQQTQQKEKPTVKEALKDSIYTEDSLLGDATRGVTTTAIRNR